MCDLVSNDIIYDKDIIFFSLRKSNSFNLMKETFISIQLHSVESLCSLSLGTCILALSCLHGKAKAGY